MRLKPFTTIEARSAVGVNEVSGTREWIHFGWNHTFDLGKFLSFSSPVSSELNMQRVAGYNGTEKAYMQMQLELSPEKVTWTRNRPDIIELLAIVGGLAYFLINLFGTLVAPWVRY